MAKRAAKSQVEITEVQTPRVENRIKLEEVIDQLAVKAGGATSRGVRAAGAGGAARERLARIKELSEELAQELRALQQCSKPVAKAPPLARSKRK